MPQLVVREGPLAGSRFEVDAEIVLGRDAEGIVLDDKEVSRRHARVTVVEEALLIEDLGSTNGTFVNQERIVAVTTLKHGDVVRVGATVIEVHAVVSGATVVAAPVVPAAPPTAIAEAQPPPVAEPPPPPPAAEPVAAPVAAPSFVAAPSRRGSVASRQLAPIVFSFVAIAGTALGLILYFALR